MQIMPTTAAAATVGTTPVEPAIGAARSIAAAPRPLATQSVVDPSSLGIDAPASAGARAGRQDAQVFAAAAQRVLATDAGAHIARDDSSNAATFLSGQFHVKTENSGVNGQAPADGVARSFLTDNGSLFGLSDQAKQLQLISVERDQQGFSHYKYQQVQDGKPVFGQQLIVHAKGDVVTAVAGHITPNLGTANAKVSVAAAGHSAIADATAALKADGITPQGTVRTTQAKLGWYTLANGVPRLAYETLVGTNHDGRWQMYVDATTGKVIDKWAADESLLNRETHDAKNSKVVIKEGDPATGDKAMDAAHEHAKDVYDFYNTKFGRDSIDGKGMKIISNVHIGNKYNNAYWNGSTMNYGDGDGKEFTYFSLGTDVVGHEMTHGVTERSAGLRYSRQSGALNESWSDTMGNLIEKWAEKRDGKPESDPKWLLGEAIFTPGVDGDALRSESAPGTAYPGDNQPADMAHYNNTPADNGGVHTNSGIPNKAAYEVAMAIGQDKTAEVWYRALTKYMTPSSQFVDAADATVQAAVDLYGKDAPEVAKVAAAWSGVGVKPTA